MSLTSSPRLCPGEAGPVVVDGHRADLRVGRGAMHGDRILLDVHLDTTHLAARVDRIGHIRRQLHRDRAGLDLRETTKRNLSGPRGPGVSNSGSEVKAVPSSAGAATLGA